MTKKKPKPEPAVPEKALVLYSESVREFLHKITPKEFVKKHPTNGLDYVEVGYVRRCLEDLCHKVDAIWSYRVFEVGAMEFLLKVKHVVVKGQLMLFFRKTGETLVREQYGGSEVKFYKDTHKTRPGQPMDPGNDFKAAAADAFKKCCSSVGIAQDIFEPKVEKTVNDMEAKEEGEVVDAEVEHSWDGDQHKAEAKPAAKGYKVNVEDPEARVKQDQVAVIMRFLGANPSIERAVKDLMKERFGTGILSNLKQKEYAEVHDFILSLNPKEPPF